MLRTILYIIFITALIANEFEEYLWPTDASTTVTALFGEMRPYRYHTGIDIRTFGINGKNVYAITDGYIYRIKVSNDGYGNVIYIKHDDGKISLYAHLSKFNPKIQKIITQLQIKRGSYVIDHLLEPGLINISKGDIIGYTGDTGGLSGPHLHFEIRDEVNRPLNPLKTNLGKILIDNKSPIPVSVAFIPKTKETKINGFNFTKEYTLKKTDMETFNLLDTINIKGPFGMGLKVFDKIDSQPFKYGIYSIELFIDGAYHYGIKFDKTSFNQSNQIYLERNYNLLSKEKGEYYQLFKDDFQSNTFINKDSKGPIIKDEGLHDFNIIIKDINNNNVEIAGNFIIEDLINIEYEKNKLVNNGWKIDFNNINEINDFNCSLHNQRDNSLEPIPCLKFPDISSPYAEIAEDTSLAIFNTNELYNTLELNLKTSKGEKTTNEYILLSENLETIQGYFLLDHTYDNLFINFIEEEFSGIVPNLIYKKNGIIYKEPLLRKEKNILSSRSFSIAEFSNIEDIMIEYTIADYVFSKKTNIEKAVVYPDLFSEKIFRNGEILITHEKETFFDTTLIYILNSNIKDSQSIIYPFYIGPNSVPFNKPLRFSINLINDKNINHLVLSSYNNSKKSWVPLETQRDGNKTLSSKIKSGTTIGVIIDDEKPIINNITPRNGATYQLEDLNEFEIFLKDDFSGIDYENGIILNLNGTNILTGFNLYQEKMLYTRVEDYLQIGENQYNLIVSDNANNKNEIKGTFFIKEPNN